MKKAFCQIVISGLALICSLAQSIIIEAESGVIHPPFAITSGFVSQPFQTSLANGGRAVYDFTVTNAGAYVIQARVNAPNGSSNSFFVNVAAEPQNAEPQDPGSIWEFSPSLEFTNRFVTLRGDTNSPRPHVFHLKAGANRLIIQGRGANAQLDRLTIVGVQETRPSPPVGLRVVGVP
jgi:hypothetical protein